MPAAADVPPDTLILVDTSIWIDHLRQGNPRMVGALEADRVVCHPMVVGELAMGSLRDRANLLDLIRRLPCAVSASHDEVIEMIDRERLYGRGLGYVDVHLLASTRLTQGCRLWTRDRRLRDTARELGVDADVRRG